MLKIGSLNVRECIANEGKRREIGCMFERRMLDILALSETKMKGVGECMFGDVPGMLSGIAEGRAKEGVAMLMSERIINMVVECKRISPRLMWVKVKMGKEGWVFVSAYVPGSEKTEQQREIFLEEITVCE